MRVGYFSAYYRGLDMLLDMWPVIYERLEGKPKLDIYYGWQSWDALGYDPELKPRLLAKLKALEKYGVTEHGRVDHKQLARAMKKIDVWAYPTEFPEIHCITALKAQQAKCYPVTTNVAALDETVQSGVKIDCKNIYSNQYAQKKFIDAVVSALELQKRGTPVKGVSWTDVSNKWEEVLNG